MSPRSAFTLLVVAVLAVGAYVFYFARGQADLPELPEFAVPGANANQGKATLATMGCGACHSIPGVQGALGKVGPPLVGLRERAYIAGRLPNTPDNLALWIQHPQVVDPGNAMPEMGVSEQDARNIAAYLYTLR